MAYLMTHSLLASWLRTMKTDPFADATTEDTSKEEFLRVLARVPTPTNEAMQKGIEFENLITNICGIQIPVQTTLTGAPIDPESMMPENVRKHQWFQPAFTFAQIVRGGQLQHVATKRVQVHGMDLLLYGRLDVLKAGRIYDIKFSGTYDRGKYFDSTQHPMYLELVPSAESFTYLISNGMETWTEQYRRDETPSIYPIISDFLGWLEQNGLMKQYTEFWGEKK